MAEPPASAVGDQAHVHEERWYLNDQREFLLRSIADATEEHRAGDLTDEDFSLLMSRDRRKLSKVEAELAGLGPAPASREAPAARPAAATPDPPHRSPWRLVGIAACSALIVAGIVILLVHALNPRLPGQSTSGGITQPQAQLIEQQLAAAATLSNQGQFANALKLYDKVLAESPSNPEALAGSGWLEWSAGRDAGSRPLMSLGQEAEEKSIRARPSYFGSHLYLGLILYFQDRNDSAAAAQFADFLDDHPPSSVVTKATPQIKAAYSKAGLTVPAALTARR